MVMEFKRMIEVTKETREFLRKAFGVTDVMVWYDLTLTPSVARATWRSASGVSPCKRAACC